MSSIRNRFEFLLRKEVAPAFRSFGFKKVGDIFYRQSAELLFLIAIHRSRGNDENTFEFTCDCGIYIPEVVSRYLNRNGSDKPKIHDCCCSIRIGMLSEEKNDIWWALEANKLASDDSAIAASFVKKVELLGIPFLSSFESSEDVGNFLSREIPKQFAQVSPISEIQRLAYSAIIFDNRGNKEKAVDLIKKSKEKSKGSPIENHIMNLCQRLSK